MEIKETVNELLTSQTKVVTSTNWWMAEWDSIYISSNERMSLSSNCTNDFTAKFQDLNTLCVLKFKSYWLKKPDNRMVNSSFFRVRDECKFDN